MWRSGTTPITLIHGMVSEVPVPKPTAQRTLTGPETILKGLVHDGHPIGVPRVCWREILTLNELGVQEVEET